jgi:mannosyl-oligosaccharide alpha-1,2-mannosidase
MAPIACAILLLLLQSSHAARTQAKLEDAGCLAPDTRQAEAVRSELSHLWNGYRASAFGADEVRPMSGGPGGKWGDVGMLVLDSLDTLWLAGMHNEFSEGEQWVANLSFAKQPESSRTSLFELTIRGLGGLLSAHALSGRAVFLRAAKALGENVLSGFMPDGKHHRAWPVSYIDARNPADIEVAPSWHRSYVTLADVGSNILELTYLSRATGDPRYEVVANDIMGRLINISASSGRGLLPVFLDPRSSSLADGVGEIKSVSAFADSHFEYLLKAYLLNGNRSYLSAWKVAMRDMRATLIHESKDGWLYVASDSTNPMYMEELGCFVGGMLALGAHSVDKGDAETWWLPVAERITHTCYETYRSSPSGIAPETVSFSSGAMQPENKENRLRPETLESLYYLYIVTGDKKYKSWSWNIFNAIVKHTKVKFGFAAVSDVTRVPVTLRDSEETFMGAETLKYAYLIQQICEPLPLDKFVFTTEAHPLPVLRGDVLPL